MNNNQSKVEVKVFIGFSNQDLKFKNLFANHLSPIRENINWFCLDTPNHHHLNNMDDRNLYIHIQERLNQISSSQVILFLISPALLSLEKFDLYVQTALAAKDEKGVEVIPIILDFCTWNITPLKDLEPLPKNGYPVTHPSWSNQNQAFTEITDAIHQTIEDIRKAREEQIQIYRNNLFQYKIIVQNFYKQNSNLSSELTRLLMYHQQSLNIQDRDAKQIETEVKQEFSLNMWIKEMIQLIYEIFF